MNTKATEIISHWGLLKYCLSAVDCLKGVFKKWRTSVNLVRLVKKGKVYRFHYHEKVVWFGLASFLPFPFSLSKVFTPLYADRICNS